MRNLDNVTPSGVQLAVNGGTQPVRGNVSEAIR